MKLMQFAADVCKDDSMSWPSALVLIAFIITGGFVAYVVFRD